MDSARGHLFLFELLSEILLVLQDLVGELHGVLRFVHSDHIMLFHTINSLRSFHPRSFDSADVRESMTTFFSLAVIFLQKPGDLLPPQYLAIASH